MRKSSYLKYIVLMMLITLVCLFFVSTNRTTMLLQAKEKTVLFISSYSYDWGTVPKQIDGIIEGLDDKYDIIYEFMDTKRVSYNIAKQSLYEKIVNMKNNGQSYDAVIVGDDDALRFVEEYKEVLFADMPIAFEGINDIEFAKRMAQDNNIMGVIEALPYDKNVKLVMSLFPQMNKMVAIVDSTNTGKGEEQQFVNASENFNNFTLEILNASDYTKEKLQEKLLEYDDKTIIFYLIMSFDKDGNLYSQEEVENIFNKCCSGPVIRMTEYGISDSVFGGITVSHKESGKIAGQIIDRMLTDNTYTQDTSVIDSPCEYVFNYQMMKKFDVSEVMLPEKSTIINRDNDKKVDRVDIGKIIIPIFFVVLIFIVVIVFKEVVVKRAKNNKSEIDDKILISDAFLEKDTELISKIAFHTMKQEFSKVMLVDVNTKESFLYFIGDEYNERKYLPNYEEEVKTQLELVVEEDKEHYKNFASIDNILKNIQKVGDKYITEVRQLEDGIVSWYEYRFTYFNDDKNIVFMLKRKLDGVMAHEVEEKDRLQLALAKAKKRNNEKLEYLSELSHEIRTLVNSIKGLLELIKDEPDKFSLYTDKAIMVTNNLANISNDFLDYSKMESGNMELHKEILNISELKDYIYTIIEPLARDKNQQFVYNCSKNYYSCFVCDTKKLKQILINVLTNAVKYTPKNGKIILNIDERKLDNDNLVEVKFEVIDNGIGMTSDFLKHVYEPFKQEHRYKSGSSGLGLAITKNLVDLMNGKIKIESQKGVGTNVMILMILEGVESREINNLEYDTIANKDSKYKDIAFDGKMILIADDNDINMEVMESMLKKLKINVIKASDGIELVDKFRENEENLDLIITDALMPKLDGISAIQIIRDTKKGKDIPIIMMTANSYVKDEEGFDKARINYTITKPFEKREVIDILAKEFYNDVVC